MGAQGLEFQVVDVKFTEGLDTRTQRKLVVPGKWDDLLNLTLSDDNTPQTRDGHSVLVAAANGNGLATFNDQLLTINGPDVYSISPTAGTANQVGNGSGNFGVLGNVGISKAEVRSVSGFRDLQDCANGGGFTCYVWREKDGNNQSIGIYCTLIDETTGTQIISAQALNPTIGIRSPRVVYSGGAFFIFYLAQGTSLYCRVIETSAPTVVGAEVVLVSGIELIARNFDACRNQASHVMVLYAWNDGVTSVRTIDVVQAGTVPSINFGPVDLFAQADVPANAITALCCAEYPTGTELGAFVTSTGATAQAGLAGTIIDGTTFGITDAATQLDPTVGASTGDCHLAACWDGMGGRLRVFRDFQSEWGTDALTNIFAQVIDNNLNTFAGPANIIESATYGAGVDARGAQGPFIHGKPFRSGGRIFLPVFVASAWAASLSTSNPRTFNSQNTFFVLDTGPENSAPLSGVVVAKALYGSYGLASTNSFPPASGTPCSSPEVSSGNFATLSGELTRIILNSAGTNISPNNLVRLTMSPNFSLPPIREQLGESTYFAGGSLTTFDGTMLVEQGFPLFPEGVSVTAAGAGGAMTAGVHQICFIFEWTDGAGQRHQSAPSPAVQITTVANDSLTCEVPSLLLSRKTDIQIVPYITQAGGIIFNRVLGAGGYFPTYNTTSANISTIIVDGSDASVAGNELLYHQPNQAGTTLPNVAPGPSNVLTVAQNRLWFDRADQPGQFGFSQEYVNNVGLQFSPDLSSSIPSAGGDLVAIAEMDEKMIIFCSRRIFVVYGTGPTSSGGFNNYSEPQDIQSDVGCSDARSVLSEYPGGIIFKSQKGWYALGRDLSTKYIGAGVARWDAQTVSSAVILEDRQECRFLTDGTYGPITLVYSYLVDQWSYFVQTGGDGYTPIDAMWWPSAGSGQGRYVTISRALGLNQDTPGIYIDQPGNTAPVGYLTRGRTSWLHLDKLEQFQRVRWLYLTATANVAPTSSLTIGLDFDDAYGGKSPGSYSFVVNLGTAFPGWVGAAIDLRHKLRRQKCKSVAFTFTENASAGPNRLSGFQALALELGLKRGTNKLPALQSVG